MTNDEIIHSIEKLQYQVSILGQAIDFNDHPVEALIMDMDWDRKELNKVYDIFESWDKRLDEDKTINSYEFEKDFYDNVGVSYQSLKLIVNAFYKNHQWTNVCEAYVDSFGNSPAVEYHSIMRRKR